MKVISATDANRDFSKLLDEVVRTGPVGISKRGKIVATLNPVKQDEDEAEAFKRAHLGRLRNQPALGVPRGTRDELYDDDP
ncbi:MAG: type II toxin-antitoxin system Phd/YefM family antitoxin [Hyphomicrobiales bacterium]